MEDDGRGQLLRVELVFLGEGDADRLGVERRELLLVGEIRAGGVAEGIAAVAVALRERRLEVPRRLRRRVPQRKARHLAIKIGAYRPPHAGDTEG